MGYGLITWQRAVLRSCLQYQKEDRMLKVLIADDERIVRKTLRLIGNWDEYEMEIVGGKKP